MKIPIKMLAGHRWLIEKRAVKRLLRKSLKEGDAEEKGRSLVRSVKTLTL